MSNEGRVYFGLIGDDFDPKELTEFLGINPSKAKKKANPIPKKSYWNLSSDTVKGEIVDIYKMSSSLIKTIKPHTKEIIEAKQKFNLEAYLQVVLWITTDETKSTPIIGFEDDVIEFLYKVKASIDIDTYRN
ncbi:MAG: DUF4279 domain-containing protein [Candidatus Electrothrix sp. GW3-4]|uniref:DUF4279 domain-containing protein n=1 Tax=Candidatus Electrothrix sp. GW3-4 TaxID=3126740 RepID=UPI0030CB7525